MSNLIPEPEICPKRIHGVNWYDKLEQPRKKNMEGCKELIKMMDT